MTIIFSKNDEHSFITIRNFFKTTNILRRFLKEIFWMQYDKKSRHGSEKNVFKLFFLMPSDKILSKTLMASLNIVVSA